MVEEDVEMVHDGYGESVSGYRRASSSSAAGISNSASAPPSSASSTGTLRRSSLANIVHDMDVQPVTTHEVIEVDPDSDDSLDSEGEGEGEHNEGEEPEEPQGEVEPEAEDDEEEEEDSEDSDEEEDDEGTDDEADIPTATQPPVPTSPPKISISDLTTDGRASTPMPVPVHVEPSSEPSAVPATDAPAAEVPVVDGAAPAAKKVKPVSAKRKRTPSPSPPPAPPPIPIATIRLQITLGGPSNYEVDIRQRAKDTGQRPASPPPLQVVHVVEDEEEPEEADNGKKRKRKKKNAAQEYYDTSDPFIDDSELAVDQRTHVAQTKQQGFYVSSGEIALLKDVRSPKKPKSKKPSLSATLHSKVSQAVTAGLKREASGSGEQNGSPEDIASRSLGTNNGLKGVGITNGQNVPAEDAKGKSSADSASAAGGWVSTVGDDEGDEKTGQKRKRYITVVEGGKKRKVVNITSFHPELQAAIEDLKKEIAKENWEQKGKFPPALKPHLSKLALLAIKLDEYDDHFFNLMPTLFPYNKFTMTKLIKRTVYPEHVALLQERQDELLKELETLSKAGFLQAEAEWQKSVSLWDKRQEKIRLDNENVGTDGAPSGGPSGSISAAPTRHSTEEKDGMDIDPPSISAPPGTQGTGAGNAAHPPAKKYRLTEQMKAIIWDLVLLSNECCRLENEKNHYEGSVIQVSEQGLRKMLYQKIVAAFPDGWMSSGQISRDVSAMKKRLEKEALENE